MKVTALERHRKLRQARLGCSSGCVTGDLQHNEGKWGRGGGQEGVYLFWAG